MSTELEPSIEEQTQAFRLELEIQATHKALVGARTSAMKHELAAQMKRLIGQRSPWKIAELEAERGLNVTRAKV